MTTHFQPGDVVRYSVPEAGEESSRFVVLEAHENRLHMRLLDPERHGFASQLAPVNVVALADVEIA